MIEPISPKRPGIRRTLMDIPRSVGSEEVFLTVEGSPGWPYSADRENMQSRDRAWVYVVYIGALRASEALRIRASQFVYDSKKKAWVIKGVKLSKEQTVRHLKDGTVKVRPRIHTYRESVMLPMKGERAAMTERIIAYVKTLEGDAKLFPFGVERGRQIVKSLTGGTWNEATKNFDGGLWSHYFRAQGERYLYRRWKRDLIRTAAYLEVDPRTLLKYLQSEETASLPAV